MSTITLKKDAKTITVSAASANISVYPTTRVVNLSDSLVTATGGTTARKLEDHFAALLGPTWDAVDYPVVIAHRGGAYSGPENTFPAYDIGADVGPIECDVWPTADRALVLMHDELATRTTGVATKITRMSLEDVRTLVPNVGWDTPYPHVEVPTFEKFLQRYGRTTLCLVELKGDAASATAAAEMVKRLGMQRSVILQSFIVADIQAVTAVDSTIKTILLVGPPFPAAATVVGYGAWGIGVDTSAVAADFTAYHDAGLKVFVWTVSSNYDAQALVTAGADGIITNQPTYIRQFLGGLYTPTGTYITPPASVPAISTGTGVWALGAQWRLAVSASVSGSTPTVSGGFATYTKAEAPVIGEVYLIQPGIRAPAGTWTFTTTLKLAKAAVDTTRLLGLRWGFYGDRDMSYLGYAGHSDALSGYFFAYRATGAVLISKVVGGVETVLVNDATWAALSEGDEIPLRIDVTPTDLTVTQTTSGKTITVANADLGRAGFISAFGSGQIPGLGVSSLTY